MESLPTMAKASVDVVESLLLTGINVQLSLFPFPKECQFKMFGGLKMQMT